jgi:diguanylate cyclase (GGDEF)-like protein
MRNLKIIQSKLAIAVILWGWLLFAAWISYDYVQYGNNVFIHIFKGHQDTKEITFNVMIILVPFIYTILGIMVNERLKLLNKLQEFEKYRSLALVDDLTSLFNRRGFSLLAGQQIKLSDRQQKGMLLVYVDLDGLKQLNDKYGHQEGDMALITVAKILKDTFRESDIIARIGGDEFVILAIEASLAVSDILASRLQDNIQHYNTITKHPYKLSLSVGFSYYDPENPHSIEELIAEADRYMYEEKQGRQLEQMLDTD